MSDRYEHINSQLNAGIENRNADASINGYLYQFELTLYHMLLDKSTADPFQDTRVNEAENAVYQVESVEDYIKYFSEVNIKHIRVAQIKYHSGKAGPKEYAEPLVYLYYGYLKYRSLNIPDSTYKAAIFHHDKSNTSRSKAKIVSNILEQGFNDLIGVYLQSKENAANAGEKFEPKEIFELIIANDCEDKREEFARNASFVWSLDRKQLIDAIKDKLLDRYHKLDIYKGESRKGDFYYALALSKLVNDFRLKDTKYRPTSLDEFDEHFSNFSNWDILSLLEIKLSDLMLEHMENVSYTEEEEPSKDFVQTIEVYQMICDDILTFMLKHLSMPQNRLAFFNTIIPSLSPMAGVYKANGSKEWEFFLENVHYIKSFIGKLAKMMFYYKSVQKEDIDLDRWFDIGNEVWKFHFPLDKRKHGVIIGSIGDSASPDKAIGELKRKLLYSNTRVWYLCEMCTRESGRRHQYKHAIDSPSLHSVSIDSPSSKSFHIECLFCLGLKHHLDVSDTVGNVFEEECPGVR
ncbi:hypothetical protein [Anaerospora hongkongensis]|uniref:hypothetical protein n=1 Tax=Anaerospora hongkongensis TaxID=244830 RepID=UPI002FD8F357